MPQAAGVSIPGVGGRLASGGSMPIRVSASKSILNIELRGCGWSQCVGGFQIQGSHAVPKRFLPPPLAQVTTFENKPLQWNSRNWPRPVSVSSSCRTSSARILEVAWLPAERLGVSAFGR